jgi:nucleotide-binding universal stress UspA family protein
VVSVTDLFDRVLLPVADPEDARATCEALAGRDVGRVRAIHVIEKGGGSIDKASVEQREEYAEEVFDVVEATLPADFDVETDVVFGTDVAEAVFAAADDFEATSIVITPRSGNRWIRLLTGDVALELVTESDRPVVVLPDVERADEISDGDGDVAGTVDDGDVTGTVDDGDVDETADDGGDGHEGDDDGE